MRCNVRRYENGRVRDCTHHIKMKDTCAGFAHASWGNQCDDEEMVHDPVGCEVCEPSAVWFDGDPWSWEAQPCPTCRGEIALCRRCRNGVDRDHPGWTCMAHDDRVRIDGVHPIRTPECIHPDADWHDDGCVLPDTGLTVHDITHAGAAA